MKNSVLSVFSVVSFYSRLINTPSKNLVRSRSLMLSKHSNCQFDLNQSDYIPCVQSKNVTEGKTSFIECVMNFAWVGFSGHGQSLPAQQCSVYFQSSRIRNDSATCRSGSFSINWNTVTNARLTVEIPGFPSAEYKSA